MRPCFVYSEPYVPFLLVPATQTYSSTARVISVNDTDVRLEDLTEEEIQIILQKAKQAVKYLLLFSVHLAVLSMIKITIIIVIASFSCDHNMR